MELRDHKKKRVFASALDSNVVPMSLEYYNHWKMVFMQVRTILDLAGGGEILFSIQQLQGQILAIHFLYSLIQNPGDIGSLSANILANSCFPKAINEIEALVVGRLIFDSAAVAFCAVGIARISDGDAGKILHTEGLLAREISIIDLEDSSFAEYEFCKREESGLSLVLTVGNLAGLSIS